ncbi:MAG: hypothetical protein PHP44_00940 [Kiritimatiellae bacterium]|nr:hypothetical protein [Kiritimatiellia bacterium]
MKRSILIVMIDVMVLSALSLNVGRGSASFLLPVYQWNSIIQKGMEREKEFQQRIEELKRRAEQAERQAKEADGLIGLHKELNDTAAQQAGELARREAEAYRKMQEADQRAREAEVQARVAEEQKKYAEEARKQAEAQRKDAERLVRQAEKAAAEAERQAATSREREQEVKKRIAAMQEESTTLLDQSVQTSKLLQDARHDRDVTQAELHRLLEAKDELSAREKAALEQIEAERKKAEELLVQARLAESQAQDAQARVESSQHYISALRERIVSTKLSEQETQIKLQQVEEQREELKERLDELESEKNQSVWVQRDQALVGCSISISSRHRHSGERALYQEEIYVPVIQVGTQACLAADFDALGLSWWHVQYGDSINEVAYTLFSPTTNAARTRLTAPLLSDSQAPSVCYLPVDATNLLAPGLTICGISRLKQERIQEALAFSPVNPDASVRVHLTPTLDERFLTVKPAQAKGFFSRRELRQGDYLLSETGLFIGLMISNEKAYVMPTTWPGASSGAWTIPITRADSSNEYLSAFSDQAQKLKKALKAFDP